MKIALIGSGSWGTAVAGLLARHVDQVVMWAHSDECVDGINTCHKNPRYLTDYQLPLNVCATSSLKLALQDAQAAVIVVPSTHLRSVCVSMAPYVSCDLPLLCLTKGIEYETGYLMTDILSEVFGNPGRVAALSGPNHAEEICKGGFAAAVVAAKDTKISDFFKSCLLSHTFRVYTSQDVIGVELCAAMKNIIAIACGIASGYDYGDNTLALLMTRGLAEISRMVYACGGNPLTCMGLAGMGDLIATCSSKHSRNRTFGECLSSGESLESYQERTHMVVEGAQAARSVSKLAHKLDVDAPITFALDALLWRDVNIEEVFAQLIDRMPSEEFYGL